MAAVSQNVLLADSIATIRGINNYCGLRTYSVAPTFSWLSIASDTVSVVTSNVADVGVYTVNLTIGL